MPTHFCRWDRIGKLHSPGGVTVLYESDQCNAVRAGAGGGARGLVTHNYLQVHRDTYLQGEAVEEF